jgi:hypothetical protein
LCVFFFVFDPFKQQHLEKERESECKKKQKLAAGSFKKQTKNITSSHSTLL